jgi:Crp-like helix-turn-helix domain
VLILLELAETFGVRDTQGTRLTVTVRHKDLAELAGASRPRVSEYLMEFESNHLIERRKRQFIVKCDRLGDFLSLARSQVKSDGRSRPRPETEHALPAKTMNGS